PRARRVAPEGCGPALTATRGLLARTRVVAAAWRAQGAEAIRRPGAGSGERVAAGRPLLLEALHCLGQRAGRFPRDERAQAEDQPAIWAGSRALDLGRHGFRRGLPAQ